MVIKHRIGVIMLMGGLCLAGTAQAAGPAAVPAPLPHTVEPGRQAPQPSLPPKGEFEFSFPEPYRTPMPRDVEGLHFTVREIVVDGAVEVSPQELSPLTGELVGKEVTLGDIIAVAERIEAKYREKGFLLVRAFVPPQKTRNGIFHITVVEGFIKTITVEGVDGGLRERLSNILTPIANDRPLRESTIERAMLLVNDMPGIKGVGLVRPSPDEPGAADLVVNIDRNRAEIVGSVDNRNSRYSGPWTLSTDAVTNSLFGQGEQLALGVTTSPDYVRQNDLRLRYLQPVGPLTLTSSVDRGHGLPGLDLRENDVKTRSLIAGQRVSFPVIRSRAVDLILDGGLSWKEATIDQRGQRLSTDRWWVVDAKVIWSQSNWLNGVNSAVVGAARGLPGLGSAKATLPVGTAGGVTHEGDPQFTKLTLDLHRIQSISGPWSAYGAVGGQYSFNRELAGEEFAMGSTQFGRGFDPAQVSGDHGLGETLELRYDMRSQLLFNSNLQFYGFFDNGKVWNRSGHPPASDSPSSANTYSDLTSTGGGLRFAWDSGINANVELAHPLSGPRPTVNADPIRPYFSIGFRY
ncbi:MAG TPA: ShlB/FhaC/HecB family hemolysin secretion/activation protein [Rhodospirillaceae bacterium]|nr:ShlB/FhaC/HecB family hemolysin secretion/activation protein [Rhodospirillaceae bacterium]